MTTHDVIVIAQWGGFAYMVADLCGRLLTWRERRIRRRHLCAWEQRVEKSAAESERLYREILRQVEKARRGVERSGDRSSRHWN